MRIEFILYSILNELQRLWLTQYISHREEKKRAPLGLISFVRSQKKRHRPPHTTATTGNETKKQRPNGGGGASTRPSTQSRLEAIDGERPMASLFATGHTGETNVPWICVTSRKTHPNVCVHVCMHNGASIHVLCT